MSYLIRRGLVGFKFKIHSRMIFTTQKWSSDRINPKASSLVSCDPFQPVALRMEESGPGSMPPISVQTFLRSVAERCSGEKALAIKRDGKWDEWTYAEYLETVEGVAKGFLALGLGRQRGVGIMGLNTPETVFSILGSVFAGGLCAGIYPTNGPETVSYLANHTPFDLLLVEDSAMLEAVLAGRSPQKAFPSVKKIVLMAPGSEADESRGVVTFDDVIERGKGVPGSALTEIEEEQCVNEACMLMFTSGTTGNPKGVMFSHDNLTYTARIVAETYGWDKEPQSVVSYLPMNHIAALDFDIFVLVQSGGTMYCADKNALKGTLVDTLKEVRPKKFLAVPRVWEKIVERLQEAERNSTPTKRKLMRWALAKGRENSDLLLQHGSSHKATFGYKLAHRLILSKIHAALGLDNGPAELGGSHVGAAPTSQATFDYLKGLGILPLQLYGSSEVTGPHTTNTKEKIDLQTCGWDFIGVRNKILNPDSGGHGEICTVGRNVFMGYIWEEGKTADAYTDDNDKWYRSGDIGRLKSNGSLEITGRIKELIITAGGENITPVVIEENIKRVLPGVVSNVMVVGDQRKYLICLLTLRVEIDPKTAQPTDKLDKTVVDWCEALGVPGLSTVGDFLTHPQKGLLDEGIQWGINAANEMALSNPSKVQKFAVLPAEFSNGGGELGPTLKLKRFFVASKYAEVIDRMY